MFNFLSLSIIIFVIGAYGMVLSRKHVIIILVSLELMLLSININFVISAIFMDDLLGELYALIVLTVAAAEIAIGLAICIAYYRLRGGISIDFINLLKG